MSVCEYYSCNLDAAYRAPVFKTLRDLCVEHLWAAQAPTTCDYPLDICNRRPTVVAGYEFGSSDCNWRCKKHDNYNFKRKIKFRKAKTAKTIQTVDQTQKLLDKYFPGSITIDDKTTEFSLPLLKETLYNTLLNPEIPSFLLSDKSSFLLNPPDKQKAAAKKAKAKNKAKRKPDAKEKSNKVTNLISKFGDFGPRTAHL